MVDFYKLDKVLTEGTTYRAPPDRGFIIRRIGTNSTAGVTLIIDGVMTGPIIGRIAPMHRTSANLAGPLDLGALFYVVPPDKQFWIQGGGSDKVRIVGQIVRLATGEAFPADLVTRVQEQGKHYLTYDEESKLYSSDYTWPADQAITIYSVTPLTSETFVYNGRVMVEPGVSGLLDGQVGVVFKLDGAPLDVLTKDVAPLGIDALAMSRPPADTTDEEGFTLHDLPITVPGDHTISVDLVNNSGGNLTVAAATDQYITLVLEVVRS